MKEIEIWRGVLKYEDRYEISNTGKCRSLTIRDSKGRLLVGKILKTQIDRCGYEKIRFCVDGTKTSKSIHRLVAIAFLENANHLPQVNHIDGCKTNNHINNLEWVTNSENQKHCLRLRLKKIGFGEHSIQYKGEVCVYKDGILIDTLRGSKDMTLKNYDSRNVSACICGKRKSYRGCTFKRKGLDNEC